MTFEFEFEFELRFIASEGREGTRDLPDLPRLLQMIITCVMRPGQPDRRQFEYACLTLHT
jgi:hypothetical protein